MERVQRRAGVEVTRNVHILRHNFCSRLAMLGLPTKAIKELAEAPQPVHHGALLHLSPQVKDQAIEILEAGESVFGKLEAAQVGGNLVARTPGA